MSGLACISYTEDCILNALRCDLEGIEMESEILDSAKNTTEAKFLIKYTSRFTPNLSL